MLKEGSDVGPLFLRLVFVYFGRGGVLLGWWQGTEGLGKEVRDPVGGGLAAVVKESPHPQGQVPAGKLV